MSRIQHIIIVKSLAYNYGHYIYISRYSLNKCILRACFMQNTKKVAVGKTDLKCGFGIKEFMQKRK